MRNIIDSKHCLNTIVLVWVLMTQILRAVHDELGNSSSTRAYIIVQRLYYRNGLKASVNKHIKQCMTCQKRNIQAVKYAQLPPRLPMQFISMKLIGPFDPSSSRYHYALMVICLLLEYTFCILSKTKTASKVVQVYVDEVYPKFGGSVKLCLTMGQNS